MSRNQFSEIAGEKIGLETWEVAKFNAIYLIEQKAPEEWCKGIVTKTTSIYTNDLQPLITNQIHETTRNALSEVLGICYLGDYALENGISFNITRAAKCVLDCAASAGVNENIAAILINRMAKFYSIEKRIMTGGITANLFQTMHIRYQLKSADICLLQRMIISNGLVELQNKKYPLDSASAALDIVDDVFDIFEDSKSMNGNLFTTFCDDFDRLKIVFDWFISPYKQKILYNLNTGDFPNYIREYLEKVVERIDNCRISLVNNTI